MGNFRTMPGCVKHPKVTEPPERIWIYEQWTRADNPSGYFSTSWKDFAPQDVTRVEYVRLDVVQKMMADLNRRFMPAEQVSGGGVQSVGSST